MDFDGGDVIRNGVYIKFIWETDKLAVELGERKSEVNGDSISRILALFVWVFFTRRRPRILPPSLW